MAIGLKTQNKTRGSTASSIKSIIEYNSKNQRDLEYLVESVKPIGSLFMQGPEEDGIQYVFPGFTWTILMRR